MKKTFKQDKGQAGLSILLSVIVMLFIIGLIVMIFTLMGSELRSADSVTKAYTGASVSQTGINITTGSTTTLTVCSAHNQGVIALISAFINQSSVSLVSGTDYTASGCVITPVATTLMNDTLANITYTYTYAGSSYDVINDTANSIGEVTDWFDIFIVIGAMVVLILLTVIIITAIRSSGMIAGGTSGANTVGTA